MSAQLVTQTRRHNANVALTAVSSASSSLRSSLVDIGDQAGGAAVNRDPVLDTPAPRAVKQERRQAPQLAAPRQVTPRTPSPTVTRATQVLAGRSTVAMVALSGRAWDLAFVAALETQWRPLARQLAALTPADQDALIAQVTRQLVEQGRLRANDGDGRRLVAYAIRLELERAGERARPPAAAAAPSGAASATAAPAASPPDVGPFTGTPESAITVLAGLARQPETPARAARAQHIVDSVTRRLLASSNPAAADAFIQRLSTVNIPVSNLPVEFRNGWVVAVNDGRAVGTSNSRIVAGLRGFDGYYRSDLRSVRDGSSLWVPRQVDLTYNFSDDTRTVSAVAYARTLRAQYAFQHSEGWTVGSNPYDLERVRQHFEGLLNRGMPAAQVFTRWQQYLTSFYLHGHSLDIQGAFQVLDMRDFEIGRLVNDTQGLVDDLLPARTGQRLLDCEFFAAITTHVFSNIRRPDGQKRYDTYWVLLDTHAASVVVERPNGGSTRNWAFVNNNYVQARGVTTMNGRLDPAIIDAVGEHIFGGRPAVFAVEPTHRAAAAGSADMLQGPRVGANLFNGDVSRVTALDNRAYWIYAETREKRFQEHAKHEDFVRSWSPYREAE